MNLLLVSDLGVGGSETKTVRLANALQARGRQIAVGWLSAPETLAAEIEPGVQRVALARQSRFDPAAARRLADWVREHRPKAILCVNLYPTLYALPARWLAHLPVACATLVNTTEFANRKEALQMRLIYRHTLARMHRVLYGCNFQRNLWLQRYALDAASSRTIYNGVRLERFHPDAVAEPRAAIRARLGISPDSIVVGTVGAFRPEKAQADLLRAVAGLLPQHAELRVLLVGDGGERSSLEQIARDSGLGSKVIFAGSQRDVRPFLRAMDIFALPSLTETFSNATLEAMAMSVPVVLGSVGGAAEMVVPGESGLLFTPGDIAELTHHLRTLASSADTRAQLGARARSRVEQHFSFEGMLGSYEELLDELGSASERAATGQRPVASH